MKPGSFPGAGTFQGLARQGETAFQNRSGLGGVPLGTQDVAAPAECPGVTLFGLPVPVFGGQIFEVIQGGERGGIEQVGPADFVELSPEVEKEVVDEFLGGLLGVGQPFRSAGFLFRPALFAQGEPSGRRRREGGGRWSPPR